MHLHAFFSLAIGLALVISVQTKINKPCSVTCKTVKKKPVCASDGRSYPSKCEVRRQRICFGYKSLQWLYEGECKKEKSVGSSTQDLSALQIDSIYGSKKNAQGSQNRNCTAAKLTALRQSQEIAMKLPGIVNSVTTIMIPECKADGSWEEVQCHPATRYCWCVTTTDGRPIPQTSIQDAKPRCGKDKDGINRDDPEPLFGCTDTLRAVFNSALLQRFSAEYGESSDEDRRKLTSGFKSEQGITDENWRAALWKFNSLDKNSNGKLTRKETRGLKREIKKKLKPKKCAKSFLQYCDRNSDSQITLQEWKACLGGNSHYTKEDKRTPELMKHQKRLFDMLSGESSTREDSSRRRHADQYAGSNDRIDRSPLNDQKVVNRELVSLSRKTCMDERRSGLSKGSGPGSQIFLPECQEDGRYEPTQCHTFTGYCWCVNVDTGVPIPGTSQLKLRPSCNNIKLEQTRIKPLKPSRKSRRKKKKGKKRRLKKIPGCPDPHHSSFLTQLTDLLSKEMASSGGQLPAELANNANMSIEEKSIRWKFLHSDKNNDKKLSKREMRFVRHMVKDNSIKAPEKCGKRFMRYCDIDRDDTVDINEFLICTEVRRKKKRKQRKNKSNRENIDEYLKANPFTGLLKPS